MTRRASPSQALAQDLRQLARDPAAHQHTLWLVSAVIRKHAGSRVVLVPRAAAQERRQQAAALVHGVDPADAIKAVANRLGVSTSTARRYIRAKSP